jgi:hypothetical protein
MSFGEKYEKWEEKGTTIHKGKNEGKMKASGARASIAVLPERMRFSD